MMQEYLCSDLINLVYTYIDYEEDYNTVIQELTDNTKKIDMLLSCGGIYTTIPIVKIRTMAGVFYNNKHGKASPYPMDELNSYAWGVSKIMCEFIQVLDFETICVDKVSDMELTMELNPMLHFERSPPFHIRTLENNLQKESLGAFKFVGRKKRRRRKKDRNAITEN